MASTINLVTNLVCNIPPGGGPETIASSPDKQDHKKILNSIADMICKRPEIALFFFSGMAEVSIRYGVLLCTGKKVLIACILVCIVFVAILIAEVKRPGVVLPKGILCREGNDAPVERNRAIARKLFSIRMALKSAIDEKSPPSPRALLDIEGLMERLDPAYALSMTAEEVKENTSVVDVCPEEYKGTSYGYPFYHTGWIMTNCTNARPLPKVRTLWPGRNTFAVQYLTKKLKIFE